MSLNDITIIALLYSSAYCLGNPPASTDGPLYKKRLMKKRQTDGKDFMYIQNGFIHTVIVIVE